MKILLVCSGGMSSAIVAKALHDAGAKEGLELVVDECGTQAFSEKVKEDYNISLVAPQIRHRYDVLKASADEAGVPCLLNLKATLLLEDQNYFNKLKKNWK